MIKLDEEWSIALKRAVSEVNKRLINYLNYSLIKIALSFKATLLIERFNYN